MQTRAVSKRANRRRSTRAIRRLATYRPTSAFWFVRKRARDVVSVLLLVAHSFAHSAVQRLGVANLRGIAATCRMFAECIRKEQLWRAVYQRHQARDEWGPPPERMTAALTVRTPRWDSNMKLNCLDGNETFEGSFSALSKKMPVGKL